VDSLSNPCCHAAVIVLQLLMANGAVFTVTKPRSSSNLDGEQTSSELLHATTALLERQRAAAAERLKAAGVVEYSVVCVTADVPVRMRCCCLLSSCYSSCSC